MADKVKTRLSRAEMEKVIKEGGSVLLRGAPKGPIITKVEDLPNEEELAATQQERDVVASDLRAQMRAMQARLDALEGPSATVPQQQQEGNAAQPGTDTTATPGTRGAGAEDLKTLNMDQLRDRAKAAGVKVTSGMREADLIAAIPQAESQQGR
jgi:Rho termination factor, N-terminal domain